MPEMPESMQPYQARLRDTLSLMVGTAIVLAPWFNGDDAATHGAVRLRLVAAAVCFVSLWLMVHRSDIRAESANLALGAALMTAPFWHGTFNPARLDIALAGGMVFVFAISCIVELRREQRPGGSSAGGISLN
jgi:hypothetical protein